MLSEALLVVHKGRPKREQEGMRTTAVRKGIKNLEDRGRPVSSKSYSIFSFMIT